MKVTNHTSSNRISSLLLVVVVVFFIANPVFPQNDTFQVNTKRLKPMLIGIAALYSLSLVGLNSLWYSQYDRSNFHFFNDSREWLQMDKAGHTMTTYYLSSALYQGFRWSGLPEKKSVWIGSMISYSYLTVVEIMDGFSSGWGASASDIAANTLGSGLFLSQQLGWHEQRLVLKWSFHQTNFSQFRPDQLGKNLIQTSLKDYNGQTYWISVKPATFFTGKNFLPRWAVISLGYGADGMLGANSNPSTYQGKPLPSVKRLRQYYLSFDIDLSEIPVRSKSLHTLLSCFGFIKIPFPTLEYNKTDKFVFHPLYF